MVSVHPLLLIVLVIGGFFVGALLTLIFYGLFATFQNLMMKFRVPKTSEKLRNKTLMPPKAEIDERREENDERERRNKFRQLEKIRRKALGIKDSGTRGIATAKRFTDSQLPNLDLSGRREELQIDATQRFNRNQGSIRRKIELDKS